MYRIEINRIPPTLNAYWSGMHWTKRKAIADEWHGLFLHAFNEVNLPKKLNYPITLDCTQFCKGKVRDADNSVISSKLCGDSLVLFGYLPDDSHEYVAKVILSTKKGKENKTVINIM